MVRGDLPKGGLRRLLLASRNRPVELAERAPWYVVPADRKWYRNWCVAQVLQETLDELDPQFPRPDFDVEKIRAELLGER